MALPDTHPPRPPARAGTHRVRVRYCECDPMGVVHHASYFPWLEIGRTELLRGTGVSYAQLEASGVFLVLVRAAMSYRRPGRYDDLVEVRTNVVGGSRVKIEHEYEVWAIERGAHPSLPPGSGPEMLATAQTTLACVGRDGKVRELPEWLVAPQTT